MTLIPPIPSSFVSSIIDTIPYGIVSMHLCRYLIPFNVPLYLLIPFSLCPPAGMEQVAFCTGEHAQVQSVLLLTDGLANEGIQGKEGILGAMRRMQNPPAVGDVAQKVSVMLREGL